MFRNFLTAIILVCLVFLFTVKTSQITVTYGSSTSHIVGYWGDPNLFPNGGGWYVTNTGIVSPLDDTFHGDLSGHDITNIVGMLPTFTGKGYFLVGSDGGVFAFGDAKYLGSLPQLGIDSSTILGIDYCNNALGYVLFSPPNEVWPFNCGRY